MTYLERGRSPYLNHAFFERLRQTMPETLMLVQAQLNGQPVASALYLSWEHTLYGRYWGSEVEADCVCILKPAITKALSTACRMG